MKKQLNEFSTFLVLKFLENLVKSRVSVMLI